MESIPLKSTPTGFDAKQERDNAARSDANARWHRCRTSSRCQGKASDGHANADSGRSGQAQGLAAWRRVAARAE